MNEGLITALLSILIASVISQTMAVWVKINNVQKAFVKLEMKVVESKCPFGQCPIFERAKTEAASDRKKDA